jgi:hypothetical protein
MHTKLWVESLKAYLEDLGIDGKIIFIWLRIGTSDGLLWT